MKIIFNDLVLLKPYIIFTAKWTIYIINMILGLDKYILYM